MTLRIVDMGLKRPLPVEVTEQSRPFWDALQQGRFLVPCCRTCRRLSFPPRRVCPQCLGDRFDWQAVCGRGILYSATKVHETPPIYSVLSPFRVAIVDLAEGLRIVTRLLPGGGTPVLDSPVELVVTRHPDGYHYAARVLRQTDRTQHGSCPTR